jgi:outer membrane protein assembly factor BamB
MLPIQVLWMLVVVAGLGAASTQGPPGSTSAWPGLWGPSRNAEANAPSPAPTAFQEIWRRQSAGGYSELAVAGDTVVSMELRDGFDFVVALDAATGRERWATPVAPTYKGHDGSNDGPIATPAIDRNQVFALGPHGHLVALQLPNGREQWRHDLVREFGATIPGWGFGASPLVATDRVIVPTGGENSRGLLAFNRSTGALAWSVPRGKNPGYSSAVLTTIGGGSQIVVAAGDEVFAVAAGDGRLQWTITGPDPKDVTSNPPLIIPEDRVLYSTWNLSVMAKVTRNGDAFAATELWRSPRVRALQRPGDLSRRAPLYVHGTAAALRRRGHWKCEMAGAGRRRDVDGHGRGSRRPRPDLGRAPDRSRLAGRLRRAVADARVHT